MIDGFLNTLRKTGERVQRRGEEVAQAARLRLDIFQLNRELDALYARLGRAYHGNASVASLEEIRAEIGRVDEEIAARERLLTELGADLQDPAEVPAGPVDLKKSPAPAAGRASPFAVSAPTAELQGAATPAARTPQDAQTALSVWREKEATRMTDDHSSAQDRVTNPNEAGTGEKLQPTGNTASMGNEAARDGMARHDNHLKEGELATRDPDPLASKD